jgi:PAS domain S-box-containing protein
MGSLDGDDKANDMANDWVNNKMNSASEYVTPSEAVTVVLLQALEQAPDAIVVCDEAGIIEYCNEQIQNVLGYRSQDLVGLSVDALVPDSFRHGHVRNRERFLAQPMVRPMGAGLQLFARHAAGHEVPVEISLSPVRDGGGRVIAVVRDVSERRRLLDQLALQHQHVLHVVETVRDGLVEIDGATGAYISANQHFCNMIGYSESEVLSSRTPAPWSDVAANQTALKKLRVEGTVQAELTLRHRTGTAIPVTIGASKLLDENGDVTYAAVIHDLTAERRSAAIVAAAESRLAIADDRDRIARDLHDTVIQRLFATGLTLQAAIGRADIDQRVDAAVVGIDEAIRELRTSIFSLRRDQDHLSIRDALNVTADEIRRVLPCPLVVEIARDVDHRAPSHLRDELVALVREALTNVVKHAAAREVDVLVSVVESNLQICVSDNGVGFEPKLVERGQGLRNFGERLNRLGGSMDLASSPGDGTKLVFTVPLAS